ncbi:MAG: glycosyltransferase family 2 protein [Burkholderiaceae bacterium]|nr:glycosyltransferase family 2 protein [Burkholderiaceae bacterium]
MVLTLNEARRLPACLRSASFAEQLLVIDAGSTDDTVAVARACGAQVQVHDDWQGFGVQRTRALAYCRQASYIFCLDADEEITPELQAEIAAVVASGEQAVWKLRWLPVAFGRPLRGMGTGSGMPRLFHAACLQGYEGAVHEQAQLTPGTPVRRLRHKLPHYSYDSVQDGLKKLTQYALLGASKRAAQGQRGGVLRGLASGAVFFLRFYVLQRGFLSGGYGFLYCYLLAQERFLRYAALKYDRQLLHDRIKR